MSQGAPQVPSGANQEYPFFPLTSAVISDTRQLFNDPEPVESARKIGCGTKQLTEAACELSHKINCNYNLFIVKTFQYFIFMSGFLGDSDTVREVAKFYSGQSYNAGLNNPIPTSLFNVNLPAVGINVDVITLCQATLRFGLQACNVAKSIKC